MKFLAVAALILCVGVQVFAISMEDIQNKMKECQNETDVETKKVDKALQGDVKDDPKLKDQAVCFLKKYWKGDNVVKDKVKELLEAAKPYMKKEKIQEMAATCANQQGKDTKEKIFNVFKCIYEHK